MELSKPKLESSTIQVKSRGGESRSFTIYNATVDEIYNRIYYMFEELEKSDGGVSIFHHK